jgi:hypothetical protein
VREFATLCSAAALALASAASAREPLMLAPVKPWNLHYSDNSCQLFRSFGDAANPTNMVFESLGPDTSMTMMVFGGALASKPTQGTGKVSFLPGAGRVFDGGKISETAKGKQTAIYWKSVSLLAESEEDSKEVTDRAGDRARQIANRATEKRNAASVTAVQVTEPKQRVTVLQTGSLGKVMEMMRECNREQMAGWGLEPAVQDKIVLGAKATRNLASLFTDDDYPDEAIRTGDMSVVAARLIVGADGKVVRCTPLTPFTGEGFKEVVCARLSKALFEPAELADGTKVPSFAITRIDFRIP